MRLVTTNWSCKSPLWGPPIAVDPVFDRPGMDSGCLCPLGKRPRRAIEGDDSGSPRIARLLLLCCPVAILGAIVAIVVNPVNGVLWTGRNAHICGEILDRASPSVADMDAAPSVPAECWALRVVASCDDVLPGAVELGSRQSVDGLGRGVGLPSEASATLGMAGSDGLPNDPDNLSAVTLAEPSPLPTDSWLSLPENREPTKLLSCQINELWHSSDPFLAIPIVAYAVPKSSRKGNEWL